MKKPGIYEKLHWFVFNLFAKTFGLLMVVWSIVYSISFGIDWFGNSK
jgi:hypothetical protein